MTLLRDLVDASRQVAATSSRSAKIATLAELLRRLDDDEVAVAVALLSGVPRQGRIGIGYSIVFGIDVWRRRRSRRSRSVMSIERSTRSRPSPAAESAAGRRELLAALLGSATDEEADFLRRLFTGQLRQGSLAGVMTAAVAKAAGVGVEITRRALMLSGDLARTAEIAMTDGEPGLRAVGFELFRPILPMLASTGATVTEAVTGVECASVEHDWNGIRIQIHRRDDEVRIYTRNLNEITATLPGIVETVRRLPVRQVVLDGEAIGLTEPALPHRFQDTMSRFGTDDATSHAMTARPVLLRRAASRRRGPARPALAERAAIARAGSSANGASRRSRPTIRTQPARSWMPLAGRRPRRRDGQGARLRYEAGRRGAAWRKVKPVRTVDLVVLAAEWGHGRRRGWLSNLHLGARDPSTGEFVMVGKTFKGLTDQLLTWQTEQLQRDATAATTTPCTCVRSSSSRSRSTACRCRHATRAASPSGSPGVRADRPDKAAADADTIDAVRALLRLPCAEPGIIRVAAR